MKSAEGLYPRNGVMQKCHGGFHESDAGIAIGSSDGAWAAVLHRADAGGERVRVVVANGRFLPSEWQAPASILGAPVDLRLTWQGDRLEAAWRPAGGAEQTAVLSVRNQ